MDKTELSAIHKQTSRVETANPHCFVERITYNWNCARFAANLSAYYGLPAIYHKTVKLSSQRRQQQRISPSPGREVYAMRGHLSLIQRRRNSPGLYIPSLLILLTNVCLYNNAIYGIAVYNYMLCYITNVRTAPAALPCYTVYLCIYILPMLEDGRCIW